MAMNCQITAECVSKDITHQQVHLEALLGASSKTRTLFELSHTGQEEWMVEVRDLHYLGNGHSLCSAASGRYYTGMLYTYLTSLSSSLNISSPFVKDLELPTRAEAANTRGCNSICFPMVPKSPFTRKDDCMEVFRSQISA